ncbi:hypothetical protein AV530_010512 [Patagioenas fasciata monilis]|uniref:Uncharacterized protein n=1 Tax=Patagioenas fasciata monilis TaxID=372326 RepID=A0A1V4KFD0_PATFA|nr:hypothetical protein AV530_010512 [Patagioenas fasciata monilis]
MLAVGHHLASSKSLIKCKACKQEKKRSDHPEDKEPRTNESQVVQRPKTDSMILWISRNDCELLVTPEKGTSFGKSICLVKTKKTILQRCSFVMWGLWFRCSKAAALASRRTTTGFVAFPND